MQFSVSCPVPASFRVQQIAGMFDVPLAEKAEETFEVGLPDLTAPWQIGLVVGPSGSGKTVLARQLFYEHLYSPGDWPSDRAVIDCLGELPIKSLTRLLTAVGFGSPPGWIKPYAVLSGGERFRCDLARALAAADRASTPVGKEEHSMPVVAFDEFTSVVDRTAAQFGAAAVARAIRAGHVRCRFVAVTCHYDVAAWLEPDWTIDMATRTSHGRCLRRPAIDLALFRCHHTAWRMFARHHYLNGQLSRSARCYVAEWNEQPIAFCATLPVIGKQNHWRITRIVTLPDFQGLGIGLGVAEAVADLHRQQGHRVNLTAGHPAVIAYCRQAANWRTVSVRRAGSRRRRPTFVHNYRGSPGRSVVSFEYTG